MLRICHIADIHLGFRKYSKITKSGLNQREVDVNIAFREAIDRIVALKPHVTVIAGDLFHSVRPSNTVVTFCFREIRRLAQGTKAPVIIVGGNHETPKRTDSGCILKLFAEIPGVFVADIRAEKFSFPDLNLSVFALPHAALMTLEETAIRADDTHKHNVLIAHGQIGERWISDFGGVTLDLQRLSPHEWDYVALGHVHLVRQVALNSWYAGAIEHTANNVWAEGAENKGFLEVILPEAKVKFHPLTTPREVVILNAIDGKGMTSDELVAAIRERLDSVAGGIEGKIVRLEVENVVREIYRQMDHRVLKSYKSSALHLALEIKPPFENRSTQSLGSGKKIRLEESLREFCSTWNSGDPQMSEALLPLIQKYLTQLEEGDEAPSA